MLFGDGPCTCIKISFDIYEAMVTLATLLEIPFCSIEGRATSVEMILITLSPDLTCKGGSVPCKKALFKRQKKQHSVGGKQN